MEKLLDLIDMNPEIRFGKPCIKWTRITVTDILQWLSSGMTVDEILEDYRAITEKHIMAALYSDIRGFPNMN